MKTNYFFVSIVSMMGLLSCSSNKYVVTENDLSDNKVVILGVVEYDYSQLENKNVKGLNISLDSKEKHSDIKLPEKGLQDNKQIRQKFICLIGSYGAYRLSKSQDVSANETYNLLSLMNADVSQKTIDKKDIEEYQIEKGKIINIGKIIVKYQGGQVKDGKINYTYSLQTDTGDTLALSTFKESNPAIYKKYSNDVYTFTEDK